MVVYANIFIMGGSFMAMVKCPECGHDVSDSAEKCPNCGFLIKPKKKKQH